ncbi:MAG: hypothetical protein H7263_15050 [Candidatus Sericytochromatia bacterium]|nr:hypothetical protein [Candidatus Sericytochromatia bacterium]
MKLDIIFRSCTKVYCVHDDMLRPFNANKREITLKCLKSLINSANSSFSNSSNNSKNIKIHLFDDHSPEEDFIDIKKILENSGLDFYIERLTKTGNGNSLQAVFEYAKKLDSDLLYFCEDDYLHLENSIQSITQAYQDLTKILEKEVVIFPCDYNDRYINPELSYIFALQDRHWRTVKSTTGTFVISKNILEKYFDFYLAFAAYNKIDKGGEWRTIDHIYQEVDCYSPMPSLTAHLNDDSLLPHFVDWKQLWDSII